MPDQVRALYDTDPKVRSDAYWKLYDTIFHQGKRFAVTPYVIPFLVESSADPLTPERDEVIGFLANLAVGYPDEFVPDGINPAAREREMENWDSRASPEERKVFTRFDYGPRVELDCYAAVENCVPDLVRRLDDDDPRVRRAATYVLSLFPRRAVLTVPKIWQLLEVETDEDGIANAILGLGLLGRQAADRPDLSNLDRYFTHPSFLVRTAAAVARATAPLPESILSLLLAAITTPGSLNRPDGVWFHGGNIAGYACLMLARNGSENRERIIPVLTNALTGAKVNFRIDVTRALLELIVVGRPIRILETPTRALQPFEYDALLKIAEEGPWEYGICSKLFETYGFRSRIMLFEYLGIRKPAGWDR